jgi:hypothetical protein
MTDSFEEEQRLLDPHRLDEQRRAREEMEDRLRDRGITVYPRDGDEEVGDPAFVPPLRGLGEGATEYRLRIDAAADRLRHHGHR